MVFALAVDAYRRKLSIGSVVRCAAAFACEELFVIGDNNVNTFGCHGSNKYLQFTHFFYWEDFWEHMRTAHADYKVYGIVENEGLYGEEGCQKRSSDAVETLSFHPSALFVMSHAFEGQILSQCDYVIHTTALCPQYSPTIKYDAKVAMCLHYFTSSQGYDQAAVSGEKFVVSGKLQSAKKVRAQRARVRGWAAMAGDKEDRLGVGVGVEEKDMFFSMFSCSSHSEVEEEEVL